MSQPIHVQVSATISPFNELVCGTGDVLISAGQHEQDAILILQRRPDSVPNQGMGPCSGEFPQPGPGDALLRFKNLESLDILITALTSLRCYFAEPAADSYSEAAMDAAYLIGKADATAGNPPNNILKDPHNRQAYDLGYKAGKAAANNGQ